MKKQGKSRSVALKNPVIPILKPGDKKSAAPKKAVAAATRKNGSAKTSAAPAEALGGRVKLVRDSFTIPREDFERIARLKARAIEFKRPAKKSELLRAALQALEKLDDTKLLAALTALKPIKTGRPKKHQ